MLDDISEAVLSREDVLKYPRERVHEYLEEMRTTQRHGLYRALQHPLYPILRKIDRIDEQLHHVQAAARTHRIVYASNHNSHIDYLVEPLALDDNGIRPPLITAGINLFGGPLGLLSIRTGRAFPHLPHNDQPGCACRRAGWHATRCCCRSPGSAGQRSGSAAMQAGPRHWERPWSPS